MYPVAPTNQVGTCQRGFYEERESDCPLGPEGPMARSQLKIFNNEPLQCGTSYAEWVAMITIVYSGGTSVEGSDLAGFMPSTQATVHGHLLFPDRHSKCLVNPHVRCPII